MRVIYYILIILLLYNSNPIYGSFDRVEKSISLLSAGDVSGEYKDTEGPLGLIINAQAPVVTFSKTDVKCFGGLTGAIDIEISGAVGTVSYLWADGGPNTDERNGLGAGTYSVTVTDANGSTPLTVTITQPAAALTLTTTQVNVLCFGAATGSATVTPAGGTGTYSYSWNTTPVQTTATATGLTAGTYTVTVTDANACTTNASVTITQPAAALTLTTTQVNVLCFGAATGSATVTPTGGTGTYSYSWNTTPVQTTATATGLTAGTYTVTVTDANACTTNASVTITQPAAALTFTSPTITNVTCNGANDGVIVISTSGGTGTISYSINPNIGSQSPAGKFNNLSAQAYSITATDQNGCILTTSVSVGTIPDVTPPVISGCPGAITVNTGSGSILCSQTATWTEPTAIDNCIGAMTYTTRSMAPGSSFVVGSTTVTYTFKDASNNTSTCSFTVTVIDNTPPTFTVPNNITIYSDNSCNYNASPTITGQPSNLADNCPLGAIQATYSDGPRTYGACAGTSSIIRTWSLTDAHGNTTTHQQTITIADNIKPVLTLPPTVTIECSASILPANTGQATATDNCTGSITISYADVTVSGNCAGRSTITRTWTATDCSGNSASGSQTINLQDTQPPVLTCTSFSVANPNAIPASDSNVNVSATDNCGGAVDIVLTSEEYGGLTGTAGFCPTSVTRKYVARDQCGNTSPECTQVITVLDVSGCAVCQNTVPFYPVILTGAPDSLWISPSVVRTGICCGATGPPPPKCISFNVYLDKDAVGLVFNINSGAVPTGALYYQVDCGPPTPVGTVICLTGGRFYTVTFCKPGNNQNTYSIQSISGITGSNGLVTRAEANCSGQLSFTGADPSTVTWTVKSPNDQSLLRYLSCTNCMNPIFTPDQFTPPSIVYEVCGTILGTNKCGNAPMTGCKDVTVTTLPAITIAFDINAGNICGNNIPTINAAVTPINLNYTYQWFSAPNGTGSILSTASNWKPTVQGSYSLVVTETQSGVQCNTATHNFDVVFDVVGPTIIAPPLPLKVECNDPNAAQQIENWLVSASASDGLNSVPVTNNYNGITMACNQTVTITFSAADQCGNVTTITSTISVIDTQAPTWTTVAGSLNRTISCSDAAGLAAAQALVPVATDLCNPTPTLTKTSGLFVAGTCPNAGTYTNTWTAKDACNNISAVYTQTITITDTTPPVITTLAQNQTVECDGLGNTAALNNWLANHGGAVATDACGSVSWTNNYTTLSHLCGATGSATVTFTASDVCGNSSTTQATFTIADTQAPVITCPANVTGTADLNYCFSKSVVLGTATATDNCSTPVITNNAPAQFSVGTTIVTWTATDACGKTATCTQTVTVTDTQPPVFTSCPANQVQQIINGGCNLTNITITNPTFSDNCGIARLTWTMSGATTGSSPATGTNYVTGQTFNMGITTVTYTAVDVNGLSATCSFTVWIKNLNAPQFSSTCPGNVSVPAATGQCNAVVTVPAPTIINPCNEAYTVTNNSIYKTSNTDASGTYPVGVTTVTWTITDASGNITTCTQTVTVTDTQPPVFTMCPTNQVQQIINGGCNLANVTITNPTFSDNCGIARLTWTMSGATTGSSPATGTNYVTGQTFNVGITTVTYTLVDVNGLSATCSFTVWIKNLNAPQFSSACPGNVSVPAATGQCNAVVTVPAPTIINPCNEAYTVTNNSIYKTSNTDASGTYPVGVTTVTWTITDASGNITTCTQKVTVTDTQAPLLTCPANQSQQIINGGCNLANVTITNPTFSDNCGIARLTWTMSGATTGSSPATGTNYVTGQTFNVGITTVTYTAVDVNGLSTTCSFTVWIKNLNAPQFSSTCPGNVSVPAATGQCNAVVTVPAPTITNPCNEAYTVTNNSIYKTSNTDASGTYPVGVTTVTWTITDASGNITTCTQTVTVTDTQPPVFTSCPANQSQQIINGGCNLDNVTITNPTFSDNCGIARLTWTMSGATTGGSPATGTNYVTGQTFNVGITTVTYTAVDVNGLSATCSFTVWIKNLNAPQFSSTCPGNVSVPAATGQCNAVVTVPAPTIINPCNEAYTVTNNSIYKTSNMDASGTYPVGVTTVTWTITDVSGNVKTCPQTVTVTDTQPPVFTSCPANQVQQIINGGCNLANVTITNPTFSDNCGIARLTWTMSGATTGSSPATGTNYVTGQTFNVGITTVTYTAVDVNGLSTSCSFTVWIKNLNAPQFSSTCPGNVSVPTATGQCNAVVTVPAPTIINPCNEAYTVTNNSIYKTSNTDASGTYPVGVTTVTWTITDASGNITTCNQIVTVTDLLPMLTCPSNILVKADFEQPYATNVSVPAPAYGDNCPGLTLTWMMSGATSDASINTNGASTVPLTYPKFNVGVTTITYTLTDANAHTVTCSFTVTVESKPDISCPVNITGNTDAGVCSATLDPGFPTKISGAEPITYTWIMTGATTGSGTGAIGNHAFNLGTTTIAWTATNISGTATCSQTVTVTDKEPPTFTAPSSFEFCVENLFSAAYIANNLKINPDPDYYLFKAGSTILDLDPAILKNNFSDNCCAVNTLEIHWRIDFTDTPNPAAPPPMLTHASITGTGQPSAYGSDIQMPGDGVNFTSVVHKITYWLVDCHGNISIEKAVNITIKPRPDVK